MLKAIKKLAKDKRGQSMVEYALILALIAVVVIATVAALGGKLTAIFQTIIDALPG